MITASQVVERAYRKIGVASDDEALTASQMAQGIDALNMMLAAWRLAGVDIPVSELEPVTPFPLNAEFVEGSVYVLASRLAPDFSVPVGFDADDYFRKLQAAFMEIEPAAMPLAMRRTASQRRVLR